MNNPRLVVFGYSDVGHACLKFLLERKENVVAVYTHEDKPGENLWFPSVAELAKSFNVPVKTEEDLKGVAALKPDLIFSFYYRNMIPVSVLKLAKLGAYNMHGSLLPKYRGRAPVNWAVLNGEKETGATLHVMVEKADAGDIIDQERIGIGPDDTAAQIQSGVTQAAIKVLARQIENLKAGKAPHTPQDASRATYFGRRTPQDGEIKWTMTSAQIHNLVRAVTHPYPGAYGEVSGKEMQIWKTRLRPPAAGSGGQARPGTVHTEDERLFVMCGDNKWIEILESTVKGEKK